MAKETYFDNPLTAHTVILAYDSANDRWQAVYVDASGRLQVDIAAAEQLESLIHGYIGGAWQKQPLQFGYSAFVGEEVEVEDAAAGNNTLSTTAVPAGEIHVYNYIYAVNNDSASNVILLRLDYGGTNYRLHREPSVAAGTSVEAPNPIVVPPTGVISAFFTGCTADDRLSLFVVGYRMDIDL